MNLNQTIRTTLLSAAIGGIMTVGVAFSPAADAVWRVHNAASSVCKAASGPGAAVFYFDSVGALNTSSTIQYLTCGILDAGATAAGTDFTNIGLHLENRNGVTAQYTCVIQAHHGGSAATNAIYVFNGSANNDHVLFNASSGGSPAIPPRLTVDWYMTMSCAMPTNTVLVSIDSVQDET
jgi:hypothetical protein